MGAWLAYLSKSSDFPSKTYQQVLFPTEIRVKAGLRFERVKDPTAPGTPGLERASHGDPSKAPALLLLQLSDLEIHGDGVRLRLRLTGNISAPSAGLR